MASAKDAGCRHDEVAARRRGTLLQHDRQRHLEQTRADSRQEDRASEGLDGSRACCEQPADEQTGSHQQRSGDRQAGRKGPGMPTRSGNRAGDDATGEDEHQGGGRGLPTGVDVGRDHHHRRLGRDTDAPEGGKPRGPDDPMFGDPIAQASRGRSERQEREQEQQGGPLRILASQGGRQGRIVWMASAWVLDQGDGDDLPEQVVQRGAGKGRLEGGSEGTGLRDAHGLIDNDR